jgi:uncharacterized protein YlxW (UPF0749 family)
LLKSPLTACICLSLHSFTPQAALAQHEAYAKLEAQGAQHIEKEIRKLQAQLKERAAEVRGLQQQLEDAQAQMRADERAGAAVGAATNAAM